MDDYDGIENCNGIKYGPFENFNIFLWGSKYRVKKNCSKD
jgi:hypothetical protein